MPHNERASERIGTYIFIGQHDIIVALTFVKKGHYRDFSFHVINHEYSLGIFYFFHMNCSFNFEL